MTSKPFRSLSLASLLTIVAAVSWLVMGGDAIGRGPDESARLARQILASVKGRAGLCVHVGVRDGELLVKLADGRNLVHGLAADQAAVEKAREKIEAANLAGMVSVETGSAARLPYADNLVSVLVIDSLEVQLQRGFQIQEGLRVVQPGGVAWLGQSAETTGLDEARLKTLIAGAGVGTADVEIVPSSGLWAKITKPRPKSMDQWTHPRRDATGNPVSTDKQVGIPTSVRWVAGPNWPTGNRKSAVPGVVSSDGQLVYIFSDELDTDRGPKKQNTLAARNPFNGLLLWKRKTANAAVPLISVGNRVYTVVEDGGPLVALDAGTGEVVQSYTQTKAPRHALYVEDRLVAELQEGFGCLDAASGKLLWNVAERPTKLLASSRQVFAHVDRSRRGNTSHIHCLDLSSGEALWSEPTKDWAKTSVDLLMLYDGVLLIASRKGNHGISAKDGKLLWTYDYPLIGHGGSYRKILCLGGLVWVHNAAADEQKQYAWEGLDPRTGKVQKRLVQPKGFRSKHRCSYDVATERYFMCGSMDFADLETGMYEHFDGARNSCNVAGVLPANGLLYTFPHACGCYPMLRGFLGLAAQEVPASGEDLRTGERLTTGPAFGQQVDKTPLQPHDWPTYRHDPRRSGSTRDAGPAELQRLWSVRAASEPPSAWAYEWDQKDGGRLSSPVAAAGLVLVASADRHQLLALDAVTGERRWTFTAGGRIDCPPSVDQGLCLLGARDGRVYCLRLHDGALVWRFQAAPSEQRIVAYGQLESSTPLVGGVLLYDGLAYFAAGRHAAANGGIFVGALEPNTGRLVWTQRPAGFPGVPDVLTAADGNVQMAGWSFDAKTGANGATKESRLRGGRLGLLNDAWYRRPIALRKNLQLWTTNNDVSGQIVALNEQAACMFQACTSVSGSDGRMSGHATLSGQVGGQQKWNVKMPLGVKISGMALSPQRLYVAGLLAEEESKQPPAPVVRMYAVADGKLLGKAPLDAPPVHDGLAVAAGRVYVSLQDGQLICLGER